MQATYQHNDHRLMGQVIVAAEALCSFDNLPVGAVTLSYLIEQSYS